MSNPNLAIDDILCLHLYLLWQLADRQHCRMEDAPGPKHICTLATVIQAVGGSVPFGTYDDRPGDAKLIFHRGRAPTLAGCSFWVQKRTLKSLNR